MSLYDKASIALIPSGTKASTLYSVLPANGNGDFTHSRGSIATRVNKDGLIENVGSNIPRLDYPLTNGVVGDCPHLLLEPQRTNLAEYSESFNNWGNGSSYITANQAISPDGNLTADQLSKAAAFQQVSESATTASGSTYSFSIFVKENTLDRITLRIAGGSNDVRKTLDLNDLSISDAGGNQTGFVETKVERYPNQWYKYTVTATVDSTSTAINIYAGKANVTESGNIYIWGAQFELGDYSTSYIPNLSTGITTRSPDASRDSGTSADINSEEGVLFVEIAALANDQSSRRITIAQGTSNLIRVGYDSVSNRIVAVVYDGTNQAVLLTTSYTITDFHKIAVKYKQNDFALFVDGTKVSTDLSGSTFAAETLNELAFDDGGGGNLFYGKVKQALVFNEALSDSELATLTS